MGYSLSLTADREIAMEDAQAVVDVLPSELYAFFGGVYRNTWGWTAATDIHLPEGSTWRISGSYSMSGAVAPLMAEALATRLRERGYTVTIGEMT